MKEFSPSWKEATAALIAKLAAWREPDFHKDQQLSDEVLIADGWVPTQDAEFAGGVAWRHGPLTVSETQRPHVLYDMRPALGVIPRLCQVVLMIPPSLPIADVNETCCVLQAAGRTVGYGSSLNPQIAVLIAALRAKERLGE